MKAEIQISKPRKISVPFEDGRHWTGSGGFIFTRKYDGVFATRELNGAVLVGELVRRRTGGIYTAADRALLDAHGEFFAAWTVVNLDGQDLTDEPARVRWRELQAIFNSSLVTRHSSLILAETGVGGEFVESVRRDGGEGVCAHGMDAPFCADFYACKYRDTLDLIVTEKDNRRGSIRLGELNAGELKDRGWCPCKGAFESVQVFDVVEVSCLRVTDAGKLREPVFVRVHPSKKFTLP